MLAENRLAKIVDLVNLRGSITVGELVEELDISESTIRRDLTALDEEGRLVKVRGGALAASNGYKTKDDEMALRKEQRAREKQIIGEYAAGLVYPEDFVYVDAGSSTEALVYALSNREAVYVTNAVSHAKILSAHGNKVYILGGQFKNATEAIVGEEAVRSVEKYNFTKGFFGTNGITKKNGFTTPELKEATVKKVAMNHCKDCFVLADDSKFGQISAVSFGEFDKAMIITNRIVRDEFIGCSNIVEVEKK